MIALALVTFITVFAAGLKSSVAQVIDENFAGGLVIENSDGFSPIPAGAALAAAKVPGVKSVASLRSAEARVGDSGGSTVKVDGATPNIEEGINLEWVRGGPATLRNLGDGEAVVSDDFASEHGLAVGDTFTLLSQSEARPKFTVAGEFESKAKIFGDVLVTQKVMRQAFDQKQDQIDFVIVEDGADAEKVQELLTLGAERAFPTAEVLNQGELREEREKQIDEIVRLFYLLLGLAVVISLIGVANTLALSIYERTRELGMLRAIGMSRRQVRTMIRYEAVITALIGAILGIVARRHLRRADRPAVEERRLHALLSGPDPDRDPRPRRPGRRRRRDRPGAASLAARRPGNPPIRVTPVRSHFPADSAGFCERARRDYAARVFRLSPKAPSTALGILAALVVVGIGTGIVAALETIAEPVSLGIVFIPGVLLIATVWGLWLGIGTAVLSAIAFNFFYLPPLRTFTINAQHDIVALVVFLIVAIASGTLAELARARAAESERRRVEADRALREAAALAAERDRLRDEAIEGEALRRSDELKTSLLRSVSHDLRTPLTAIIAAGAALDSPSVTADERRELSDAVVDEGQRLSRLVENLLDVSRLESGAAEPHREPVELGDLLMAARESIGANGEHVRLVARRRPAGPARRPDPARARLRQPARERRRPRRGPAGAGALAAGRAAAGGAGRRPRPRHPREPARAHLRTVLPRRRARSRGAAPGSAWRSPAASSRPTAERSRSSRCPARGRASSSPSRSSRASSRRDGGRSREGARR